MSTDYSNAFTKEEALAAILKEWKFENVTEYVRLEESEGRVAAEDIVSANTIPMMRVAGIDGFAVRSEDFENGMPDIEEWRIHEDYEPAGYGGDFPDEFDTIISVEFLHYDEHRKLVLEDGFTFTKESNIRPAGGMMQEGDLLVRKNTRITPELMANLAMGGITHVPVIKRPVVAFIPTGSELIPAGQRLGRGQNVDCNSYMMKSYLKKWGAEPDIFPIIKDSTVQLEWSMDDALKTADIVLLNGGSSKGIEDYNSRLLKRRSSMFLHPVKTIPGSAVGVALVNNKPVINIPGSTMATFTVSEWLVQPMICHFLNVPVHHRRKIKAILTETIHKTVNVEAYVKIHAEKKGDSYLATQVSKMARGSEVLREGNGFLVMPADVNTYQKGDEVVVELLVDEELI